MHPSDVPDIRASELLTVMALAEYGSFVAAAAYLKTSQPALTRTIKRVERVLGVTLFARNTRRVEITAAGREFVAVAERMLNDLQLTVRNLSEVTNEQRGRITITTYSAFAVNPLPELVRRYRETRPLIEVRIREGRQSEIVEDVRNGAADFGIGYVNTLPDMLEATSLQKEPLYVLIPNVASARAEEAAAGPAGGAAGRAARLRAQRHLPAAADRRRGDVGGLQPALQRHRRSAAQHPPPRLRRRRHRHPAVRLHAPRSSGVRASTRRCSSSRRCRCRWA